MIFDLLYDMVDFNSYLSIKYVKTY